MAFNATNLDLTWDITVPKSLEKTQNWVLSSMQKYGQELVTMLWRILGNEQDVCDAYQDTFLKLAHYQHGQKPENIKAFLFRCANNTAISMLRQKLIKRKMLKAKTSQIKTVAPPESELDSRYLQHLLRHYIVQLPEHLRNVITLRDLAELSYCEVARILGISRATARVYRCKAIQLLAVWMNRKEDE